MKVRIQSTLMQRGRGRSALGLRLGALGLRAGAVSLAKKNNFKGLQKCRNNQKVFYGHETLWRQQRGGKELLLVGEHQSNSKGSPNTLLALGFLGSPALPMD